MASDTCAITNLLYRYAELMDRGDLPGCAALFRHANVKVRGSSDMLSEAELLRLWRDNVILYPDGTPRTRHVVTNPIIEMGPDGMSAQVRSYYTVYQATDTFPLQMIAAGRYHDRVACVDGKWRFTFRDYSMLDMMGDLSAHLKKPVPA